MPSSCDGASSTPGRRPRRPSRPAPCSSPAPRPTSRRAWSPPASRSSCSDPRRPSWAAAASSSRPHWTGSTIDVAGRRALDAGASTGGFTDCLLQHGAAHVYAVDVGHGQLHPALRAHPRVTVLERTNVRTLTPTDLSAADPAFEPCPLVVADLSFISLRSVVPALTGAVSTPDADLVLLVKPQFEAGRAAVSRGKGVIRDPALWLGRCRGRGVRARMTGKPASWERWLPP